MHCQKDVEQAVRKSYGSGCNNDGVEAASYRIRAMMMHARNIHAGLWKIPLRCTPLSGIVALARLGQPPKKQQRGVHEPDDEPEDEPEDDKADGILSLKALQDIDAVNSASSSDDCVEVVHDNSFLDENELDTNDRPLVGYPGHIF